MPVRRPRLADLRRAVAYLRVSTDEQHLGPEAQRAAIEVWAQREGVEVVEWLTDQGVSGARELDDRPGLAAAVAALRTQGAGRLVVARRDRLARDTLVAGLIERAVGEAGARVVAADGAGNGDGPADEFMRTVLDGAAAYERAMIRARTRGALRAKRARGERAGTVPWGYRADPAGRLVVDEQEQAVTSRARELSASGMAQRAVVEKLGDEGFRGRTGRPFALRQVQRLLAGASHSA